MHKAVVLSLASVVALSASITSCGTNADKLQVATGVVATGDAAAATQSYSKARALESAGKTNKATKMYGKLATNSPLSKEAPDARLREANLLYTNGELIKSFDKYQLFITTYRGTSHYESAIKRQATVVHSASTGQIKNSFLGLKSEIPRTKVAKMFVQVRDNAPFGPTAPKAQFGLGQMWETAENYTKAIAAYEDLQVRYPKSSLAPEALFRVGSLLLKQTEDGNRNIGNLDTAKTTFTDLTLLYPNTKQTTAAKKMLKEIQGSDIQRSFNIAEFYEKKKQNASAAFYYKEVIRKTKSGSEMNKLAKQRVATLTQ